MPDTLKKVWSTVPGPTRSAQSIAPRHVDCPYQGRVAVDTCLSCERLRDLKLDREFGWVACGSTDCADPTLVYRPLI